MDESDRLPKMLCHQCVQNVESFMAFRNLCRNSQNKLNGWLNMATDKITLKETKLLNPISDNGLLPPNQSTSCENFLTNNMSTASASATAVSSQSAPLIIQSSNASNSTQNSNVLPITVTAVPPLASLGGGNDLLNSILQTVTIQVLSLHYADTRSIG